ncbi:hypothetical protein H755_YJM326O00126 [Saccharomyces cerevisiae YJM326]|nr:hypothetical protein H755_YJM326O00126 [Saccharomyces cerevisiae YJM326]AJT78754.1 hypothetical protein H763_YJM554O00124 [Saccharomyces cerevisiae YJM554]AJT80717.1 hypothetical protein H767_YJM682O00124 [Saccharomyces cerevisiae YJM682]AJT81207.1 hypothetical protein H768_YJM683O00121 [Saccharomyces cerevisiae YJM683]AJT89062.1 hypothetical protein H783_YJM1199O00125 [Saccharomyces cerevisiae YJM1199]AJT89554.1 hypothetical protein H784_YJM1202O00125 [Saccharomyces cerevisiae YJM1202]KZV
MEYMGSFLRKAAATNLFNSMKKRKVQNRAMS